MNVVFVHVVHVLNWPATMVAALEALDLAGQVETQVIIVVGGVGKGEKGVKVRRGGFEIEFEGFVWR